MKRNNIIDQNHLKNIKGGKRISDYINGYSIGHAIKKALHL